MSLAARSKPFRYAQARPIKTQQHKLPALAGPPVYSSGIAASENFVAVGYGASKGSVLLLPTSGAAKPSSSPATIAAHGAELGDLAWSPFVAGQLATGAADGTVKLWSVPSEGLSANLSTPTLKFDGLDSVHSLAFHPAASGVLAAGAKTGLSVFDLEAGARKYAFETQGFGKDVTSVHWSRTGALLSAVGKNASLAVVDPRAAGADAIALATPSTLVKKLQHGLFIGGEGTGSPEHLLLFGVSAAQRPVMLWVDPRNPSAAIKTHDFDFSQGYSLPIYEPDTHTLFYTIRGSEMIALCDVESDKNAPSFWPSHSFGANGAVKGLCLLPKVAVDTNACEVNRVYTLGADAVDAYAVTVPRKTAGFHAELFPETASSTPAQDAASWLAGADKAPLKRSMVAVHEAGGASGAAAAAAAAAGLAVAASKLSVSSPTAASAAASSPSPSFSAAVGSSTPTASGNGATPTSRGSIVSPTGRGASASVSYVPSDVRAKIDAGLKKSIYTHCAGREPASNFQSYFDMKVSQVSLAGAENIRANGAFFAVPWQASGGSALAVFRLAPDALGRCPPSQVCVRGHKFPASSFDLSPFDQTLLVSGCVDGSVYLWRLPERGLVKDMQEPARALQSQGKVSLVRFHPYAADVLLVASLGFDGSAVELWDLSPSGAATDKPRVVIPVHPEEPVTDFSVHPLSHVLAVSTRDGKVRTVNMATRATAAEWAPPQSKDVRVLWVGEQRLLTVGFGAGGVRSMSLFDTSAASATPKLLQSVELDRNSYQALPRFDFDSRLLYLPSAGGSFIPLYQISPDQSPHIEHLNLFQTASDTTGFVLLPKRAGDVRKVEVQRALKLTKDAVLPITYSVPRKRLEFFQDDLFPPTRIAGPEMSASEFFSGTYKDGKAWTMESLRPADMTPLSEAPEEEQTARQAKYISKLAADAAPKPVGALGHTSEAEVREHFIALQGNVGGANRWDAKQDNTRVDVDESEWD